MNGTPNDEGNGPVPPEESPKSCSGHATRCGAPQAEAANWLTSEEWNACFFLGQEEYFRTHLQCSVCEQVSVGMRRLESAGYEFRRLEAGGPANLLPRAGQSSTGEHERSCGEMRAERFDSIARARSALHWIRETVPDVDPGWIEHLVRLYDRTHPEAPSP